MFQCTEPPEFKLSVGELGLERSGDAQVANCPFTEGAAAQGPKKQNSGLTLLVCLGDLFESAVLNSLLVSGLLTNSLDGGRGQRGPCW